MIIRQVAAAAP